MIQHGTGISLFLRFKGLCSGNGLLGEAHNRPPPHPLPWVGGAEAQGV